MFIDSNITSLKFVLLHIKNQYPSIPLLYSKFLKETYTNIKRGLEIISYEDQWLINADLKLINILCGVGPCSVTNPCVLCNWKGTFRSNKQFEQYHQANIEQRSEFIVGKDSVVAQPLIKLEKVILPALHIKIGLFSQFVKQIDESSLAFHFLIDLFKYKS